MKKLVLAVMTTVLPLIATAQTTDAQMATLQHGDKTTVFLGQNAFVDAYNAAADSADVITLSSGSFHSSIDINKSVSIYGVGFENDSIVKAGKTCLLNEFKIKRGNIHIEGIKINLFSITDTIANLTINKCYVSEFRIEETCSNILFKQSRLAGAWRVLNVSGKRVHIKYMLFSNCFMNGLNGDTRCLDINHTAVYLNHCIIKEDGIGIPVTCSNSILYRSLRDYSISRNNIFVGCGTGNITNPEHLNWTGLANAGVWAEEGNDGSYSADKTFELKYPNKYIGTDGTQVGIHGGDYPWNKIPCTPRIIESDIDTKVSAEGKLKVSIKVEAQTKM